MLRKLAIPGVLALLMVVILACGGAAEPTEAPAPTAEPTATSAPAATESPTEAATEEPTEAPGRWKAADLMAAAKTMEGDADLAHRGRNGRANRSAQDDGRRR